MSVRHRLTQQGDTIIEVMMAVTVAASMLAISYATMNRNLNTLQSNQEHAEAAKLLQGQIEKIRNTYNTKPDVLLAAGSNFCLGTDNVMHAITGGSPHANISADNWSDYPATCSLGTDSRYHIGVTTPDNKNYKFFIRWDGVVFNTRNEVVMVYKIK
jgi:Tfp pilus assembly protein PilV